MAPLLTELGLYVFAGQLFGQLRILEKLGVWALFERRGRGLGWAAVRLRKRRRLVALGRRWRRGTVTRATGSSLRCRSGCGCGGRCCRSSDCQWIRDDAVLHKVHLRKVMPIGPFGDERCVAEGALHDRVCRDHGVVTGPTEG